MRRAEPLGTLPRKCAVQPSAKVRCAARSGCCRGGHARACGSFSHIEDVTNAGRCPELHERQADRDERVTEAHGQGHRIRKVPAATDIERGLELRVVPAFPAAVAEGDAW